MWTLDIQLLQNHFRNAAASEVSVICCCRLHRLISLHPLIHSLNLKWTVFFDEKILLLWLFKLLNHEQKKISHKLSPVTFFQPSCFSSFTMYPSFQFSQHLPICFLCNMKFIRCPPSHRQKLCMWMTKPDVPEPLSQAQRRRPKGKSIYPDVNRFWVYIPREATLILISSCLLLCNLQHCGWKSCCSAALS